MTPILGFVLVISAAVLAAVFIVPRINRKNPLISGIAVSGIPYVLLGVLLGPQIFGFLSEQILIRLEPLISLTLGWAGILFSIHLRWRNLIRFPLNYLLFTAIQGLIAFLIIFLICWAAFSLIHTIEVPLLLESTLILAALGCATTPVVIARTVLTHHAKGRLTHLLQFISSLDGVWAIVISGIVFSLFNPLQSQWINVGWQWLLLTLALGVIIGLAYVYLIRGRFEGDEIMLFVFGLVIFTSGVGFYLHISPIFLNMIVGVVIAQFRREAEKTSRILSYAETPIYFILLIFAGALWNINMIMGIFFIAVFIVARFLGKYWGGYIAAKNIDCAFPVPRNVGTMLLSFGGISLAIALNFQLFYGGISGNLVISVTIIGIILFDEYAAWSTPRLLRKRGEIS